ncbi:pheromone-regulated protein PRM1 [Aspergillus clavatus NRRL 1]|nr:pheromone-regulated multispanning membrane protein Prm1, putative [Aspergillus clavatus NRRL 1]EAW10558.1 pheromone-regulated multispanning membrane protein Prm1, putative [Aspergillus clavatus NRRL 1]
MPPDGLTPYLGLRARLSQVWINRWTILLLLVLVRVLMAASGLQADMGTAKREALSACSSVESMGSSMASMPHYLSQGVNELTASGVETAVSGLKSMLMLTVTGVEELVLFIIKVLYQTYLCLFTLAVRGSVHVAVGVIKDAADFLNSTVKEVGDDIGKVVSTFEDGFNKFLDSVNSVASVFGGSVPTLDLNSSISTLENLQLPSSIDKGLDKLNNSLPTFDEVNNFTQTVLRTPFEEVKKLVNQSLGTYTFDRSLLPIPAKEQLKFCEGNDGIDSFFDNVGDLVMTARKIFIAVLILAAVLACIPMAWQEIRRWRSMKERSQLVRKEAHDPMDIVYIVSRPYTAAAGIKAASRFSNSRRQILVRWAIAYATTPAALFVLCLGIAGLFSCLCQYLLLHAVEKTVPELSTQVGAFADKVVDKLENASAAWANDANGVIGHMNQDLNQNVFGWVNTSTTALNDTLNTFVDKTTGVLNETFGGTILYEPLMDVFGCLIGLKVAGIQKGLTWVHDHAHIDFPLLPNDTFSRGAAASIASNNSDASDSFLADAGDQTSNKITEVVIRVVDKVEEGIRMETIISTAILLLWVFIALVGIVRALTLFWMRDRSRGEGGGAPSTSHHTSDAGGFDDVPLTAIPNPSAHSAPAPRYEATISTVVASRAIPTSNSFQHQDEKMGFAGERQYGSALKVDGAPDLRGSAYVEYGVEKH